MQSIVPIILVELITDLDGARSAVQKLNSAPRWLACLRNFAISFYIHSAVVGKQ
jgi:hypothetical protein